MNCVRSVFLALALPVTVLSQSTEPARELPLKYSGPPTVAPITPGDLMTRLYIFADDSMMGRRVGTQYNLKGTAYLESEVRRLGLRPAGDSGGFFQNIPLVRRSLDTTSTLSGGDSLFKGGVDFIANPPSGRPRDLSNVPVIYGGMAFDTLNLLTPEDVKGKFLILRPFTPSPTFNPGANPQAFFSSRGYAAFQAMLGAAASRAQVVFAAQVPQQLVQAAVSPSPTRVVLLSDEEVPVTFTITSRVAELLLGAPLSTASRGLAGKTVTAHVKFIDDVKPGRNVVAVLPGSDPKLRGQYVAIGAHNDHIGLRSGLPVDHDSLRAFMEVVMPQGADSPMRPPTAEQTARIRAITDSLHALHPARLDSINNGADDDGSGSVSVLEIAEAFAKGPLKPKRSILFIWHTGEEAGLWGSQWFTDHPTVPRDSIVAELNMDMVGRGGATDITGEDLEGKLLHGGPGYVQLVGSRRLSTELGNLIETVNVEKKIGLRFDFALDANGHPQNIYCRSDHYEYARYGIPIVFFTTGGHADYHQVTDEPQYIDYDRMSQVAKLVYESAVRVADLNHRVVVDKKKPDPKGECAQ